MLKLNKGYSILSSLGVTKKLTQQYKGPFQTVERVGQLASKLGVPNDWRIHPVFSIAQLKPAPDPSKDLFRHLRQYQPPLMFVNSDTESTSPSKLIAFSINV